MKRELKIKDRYCWNCGLAKHDCDSSIKEDFLGYCSDWTPIHTEQDDYDLETNPYK
jgi:hypothetical protein